MTSPFTIALTGNIATGKSTVANLFAEHGITIVDCDVIARDIVEPGTDALNAIEVHFGKAVIHDNGSLNRKALGDIVFSAKEERDWLENLLHPSIRNQAIAQIDAASSDYALLVIPLLDESTALYPIDRVLLVKATPEQQLQRLQQRDKLPLEAAQAMINAQVPIEKLTDIADDIIDNSGDLALLKDIVAQLHQQYISLS